MKKSLSHQTTLSFHSYVERQFDTAAELFFEAIKQQPDAIQHVADLYAHVAWMKLPNASQISISGLDDGADQFYARAEYAQQFLTVDVNDIELHVVWRDRFGVQHAMHIPLTSLK